VDSDGTDESIAARNRGAEPVVERASRVHPGQLALRDAVDLREVASNQDAAVGRLACERLDGAVEARCEGRVERSVGVQPCQAVARDAVHEVERPAADEDLPVGLNQHRVDGPERRRAVVGDRSRERGIDRTVGHQAGDVRFGDSGEVEKITRHENLAAREHGDRVDRGVVCATPSGHDREQVPSDSPHRRNALPSHRCPRFENSVGGMVAGLLGLAAPARAQIFDPAFSAATNGAVRAIAVQADGKVLLGGIFTQVNGVARAGLARLNVDGSLDTAFTYLHPLSNLGSVYVARRQYQKAEATLQRSVDGLIAVVPDQRYTGLAQIRLGQALAGQHRYDEAERCTLAGYHTLGKLPSSSAVELQNARRELIRIYLALDQPAKAEAFKSELTGRVR
jgi:Domain of unknown function (DUF5122) beta-propeller/Tetratricopeptide repeat